MPIISENPSPEVIASALHGKKVGGYEWKALCPAHDDRSPSLSISDRDGTVLFKCWSGCSQSAVIGALKDRGLWAASRHTQSRQRPAAPLQRSTHSYAQSLYSAACDSDKTVAAHGYAKRKGISHACGARRGKANGKLLGKNADCLIIPNRNWDDEFIGVECINPEGKKQTFGSKGLLILGMPEDRLATIHVCEGWATAWALSQMFPRPFAAVVAFGCSKLEKTAQEADRRYQGDVVIHAEGDGNSDAWDLWRDGRGDEYVSAVMGVFA